MSNLPSPSSKPALLAGSLLLLFAACQSTDSAAKAPKVLDIKLTNQQMRSAIATWSDAALRIDRELIQAEAAQDDKAARMLYYRKSFTAEVLAHLRSGRYQMVVIDSENPPAPTPEILSTYALVIRDKTENQAALIQVHKADNEDLFELYEASKHDFLPRK